MSLQLIASLTSPFARKVRVFLAEKGIPYDLVVDVPWNADTQVPQFNPLGKVPVLVTEDGRTVYDSRVIVEYLEELKPFPLLIPARAENRIAVRRWEALADGIAEAAAMAFLERRRPAGEQSAAWINRQLEKVWRGLDAMEAELEGGMWCVDNSFSLADIAVGCCLGYLDFRFASEVQWRDRYGNLTRLQEQLSARSSFHDSVPVG